MIQRICQFPIICACLLDCMVNASLSCPQCECPAGQLQADLGYEGGNSLFHEAMLHGETSDMACPGNARGTVLFRCIHGEVHMDISCNREEASDVVLVAAVVGSLLLCCVVMGATIGLLGCFRQTSGWGSRRPKHVPHPSLIGSKIPVDLAIAVASVSHPAPKPPTPPTPVAPSIKSPPEAELSHHTPPHALPQLLATSTPPNCIASMALAPDEPICPSYWQTSHGTHILEAPEMLSQVQQLMTRTWKMVSTRDRPRTKKGMPTGCCVVSVLRAEHHRSFNRYYKYTQSVRERPELCAPFDSLTRGGLGELELGVNEMYLFHGTSPRAADSIVAGTFRIDLAGTRVGKMFGPGIYLAENASKSDEYSSTGDGVYSGLHAMLVCRACCGRIHTTTCPGDHSGIVASGSYDSVCGDRAAVARTFREFVFFREEAVYAEYIVIYRRVFAE